MQNKPKHSFIWLKVFACFFLVEVLAQALFISSLQSPYQGNFPGNTSLNFVLLLISVGIVALSGLLFGFIFNLFSKFKRPVLFYSAGHSTAIILFAVLAYTQLNSSSQSTATVNSSPLADIDNTGTGSIIKGDEKTAIEEVIYLMEQQYPFGAYEIVDITTQYQTSDSSAISCTIVFTVKEENNRKYISQYLVRNGRPEVVFSKLDTNSSAYSAYKQKK